MPNRTYSQRILRYFTDVRTPVSLYFVYHDEKWDVSPRINGKLDLRANAYQKRHQVWYPLQTGALDTYSACNPGSGSVIWESGLLQPMLVTLKNRNYAKMRGKLYKGSTALGVTLASYKQSRDMIREKYSFLNRKSSEILVDSETWLHRQGKYGRKLPKKIADRYLETIFGWQPLLEDINGALKTLCQQATPPEWIRVSTRVISSKRVAESGFPIAQTVRTYALEARETQAVRVRVSNPNLWLAERAGLLNAGAVAWDLVPFSFIVNRFLNVGQVVNSISDFYGLDFDEPSTTVTVTGELSAAATYWTQVNGESWDSALRSVEKQKWRTLTALTRPSLEFRDPKLSWSDVALVAALFTQNLSKIARLFP